MAGNSHKNLYPQMINMKSNELFDFIEEIPDDNNSNQGDISDDDIAEEELLLSSYNNGANDLFDIESMPIVFAPEGSSANNDVCNLQWESVFNTLGHWESDDEIPLSRVFAII
ncbi:hypothetical protein NQ318_023230 [Aromia moschata]|uniref:Uncharacterized protein n=1 Tax=Aromia moschata TaxID=1265417 RepID=A0AAV8XPB3_9CUCU|nr:hypothetical protein NQ318_023230 [Aromia moschata]